MAELLQLPTPMKTNFFQDTTVKIFRLDAPSREQKTNFFKIRILDADKMG